MANKMEKQFEQRIAILTDLLKQPENKECADCGAKGPKWASWSIGVFLCINCAGIHRSLGTHISKVKSATLDKWTDEQIDNMRNMGNARAKLIYEAALPAGYSRPREGAPSHTLESWIRAKYDKKQFMERGRTAHKEKREEPSAYHHQQQHRQQSTAGGGHSRSKPAPPSPRQSSRHQQQPQQPAKPLISMVDPTPVRPVQHQQHQQQQQGVDLFGLLGGQPQPQPQPQPQAVSGGGHDTSFFASLDGGQQQQQQQQKTLDKNSIMSLYHQPIAPTMPMGMMQAAGQQQRAPNYNVHLVPSTNMYIAPNGMPMVVGPTGQLVPAMAGGYPGAQGWPMQGQQAFGQPAPVHMSMAGAYPQGY